MKQSQHYALAVALGALIGIGGAGFASWPSYRRTSDVRAEMQQLQLKIAEQHVHVAAVEQFANRVQDARDRMATELKVIPEAPDVATIMRRLSLPVDNVTVIDQTFAAGSSGPAIVSDDDDDEIPSVMKLPVTVDMECTFDAVFSLIRSAERMDRLVRIGSIRLAADRARTEADMIAVEPPLTANLVLDVIYDPGEGEAQ